MSRESGWDGVAERIPRALAAELAPLGVAALALGLWYAADGLSATAAGRLADNTIYPVVLLMVLADFGLCILFLVSGLGWSVVEQQSRGLAVMIGRLPFVLLM